MCGLIVNNEISCVILAFVMNCFISFFGIINSGTILDIPNDDFWVRDNGPVFVYDQDSVLHITDWAFNGWGNDTPFELCDEVPNLIANELDIPEGTGLIVRTAGANRTKIEIKRDFEYLLRQWEEVRDLTLKSIAPCQIYEEGSLIKRSIRDLYTRDVDEIFVEGEEGFKSAKEFMKMHLLNK